jgi:hypothetical protein
MDLKKKTGHDNDSACLKLKTLILQVLSMLSSAALFQQACNEWRAALVKMNSSSLGTQL